MYELGTLPVKYEEAIRDFYLLACLARHAMPDPTDPEQYDQMCRDIAARTENSVEEVMSRGDDVQEMMITYQALCAPLALPRSL
jgi:hypothetical protein